MIPRRRDALTRRRFDAVPDLFWACASGFGERTRHSTVLLGLQGTHVQALASGRKGKGVRHPPLGCVNVAPELSLKGPMAWHQVWCD